MPSEERTCSSWAAVTGLASITAEWRALSYQGTAADSAIADHSFMLIPNSFCSRTVSYRYPSGESSFDRTFCARKTSFSSSRFESLGSVSSR